MDTNKNSISNAKVKNSGHKNEKKKKAEAADITVVEVEPKMNEQSHDDQSDNCSEKSTDSEELVNAFNYNTITSLAALKDIIQGDSTDTPETDSFFQHYFMNHCNNLSSRNANTNSPFPFPERRRLSQCREEDEDDEKKESDILGSTFWSRSDIVPKENMDGSERKISFNETTADQNANVVSETQTGDSKINTENKETPKLTVMGARHTFLVTKTTPAPPSVERILLKHMHNAHTVHFGTKGAEEQRPNVRSIFAKQNLHHDKNYFDSSLIEIRSTVDGVPTSSEDIWVKRTEDKQEDSSDKPTALKAINNSSLQSEKNSAGVRERSGTWGAASEGVQVQKEAPEKVPTRNEKETRRVSDERRQKREQRLDAAITRSTQSIERRRRGSSDDGQHHPMYQQTIHGTSGVSRRPALFDILKSKTRDEMKRRNEKSPTIMQQVMAAVQNMTRSNATTKDTPKEHSKSESSSVENTNAESSKTEASSNVPVATPVLQAKDGSAHAHSGSDAKYYHTVTASASRRPSAMTKVLDLFRARNYGQGQGSATEGTEKRKARALAQQQQHAAVSEDSNRPGESGQSITQPFEEEMVEASVTSPTPHHILSPQRHTGARRAIRVRRLLRSPPPAPPHSARRASQRHNLTEHFLNSDEHWRNLATQFVTENLRLPEIELQQQSQWQTLFAKLIDLIKLFENKINK